LGTALLRLKGRVGTLEGHHWVQMAPFDSTPTLTEDLSTTQSVTLDEKTPPLGLTVIVGPLSQAQENAMKLLFAASSNPRQ
jgi:hypothetical protein